MRSIGPPVNIVIKILLIRRSQMEQGRQKRPNPNADATLWVTLLNAGLQPCVEIGPGGKIPIDRLSAEGSSPGILDPKYRIYVPPHVTFFIRHCHIVGSVSHRVATVLIAPVKIHHNAENNSWHQIVCLPVRRSCLDPLLMVN